MIRDPLPAILWRAAHDAGYAAAAREGNDARSPFPPESLQHAAWIAGTSAYWADQAEFEATCDAMEYPA